MALHNSNNSNSLIVLRVVFFFILWSQNGDKDLLNMLIIKSQLVFF